MTLIINSRHQAITMTSLELVDFINAHRKEAAERDGKAYPSDEYPQLAHSDFLKKVPLVLGAEVAGNFSCYYKASNGKRNPMYRFEKRAACLMAMSYSYELQAAVFDRMTAMEKALLRKHPTPKPTGVLPGPAREFRAAHGIAKLIGLKGNQAALAANKATLRITGLNMLQTLDAEKLIADDVDPHMTVTEIGSRLGATAVAINDLLIAEGYQTRHSAKVRGKVRHRYTPTDKGKRYAVLVDMDKAHVAGKPVQNLEWKASIMPLLALAMKKEVA